MTPVKQLVQPPLLNIVPKHQIVNVSGLNHTRINIGMGLTAPMIINHKKVMHAIAINITGVKRGIARPAFAGKYKPVHDILRLPKSTRRIFRPNNRKRAEYRVTF